MLVSNKHLAMLLPNQLERLQDELELNKCYFSLNKAQNQLLCNNKNSFKQSKILKMLANS